MRSGMFVVSLVVGFAFACGDDEPDCDCAEVGCFAEMCTKTVFVTRSAIASNFGGVAAADAICAQEAATAGLAGTYYAWLSDKDRGPNTRFSLSTVPYVTPDGVQFAADWDGLSAGPVGTISVFADGTPMPPDDGAPAQVWTGTTTDGYSDSFNNASNFCAGWTANVFENQTLVGWVHERIKPVDWTRANLVTCAGTGYLYCFQQ